MVSALEEKFNNYIQAKATKSLNGKVEATKSYLKDYSERVINQKIKLEKYALELKELEKTTDTSKENPFKWIKKLPFVKKITYSNGKMAIYTDYAKCRYGSTKINFGHYKIYNLSSSI